MVKGSKKAWLLKAGVVFLAAIIGVFMLIPAGTLFAQVGSLEGRWESLEAKEIIEFSGTTGTVVYSEVEEYIGSEVFRNIAQIGDNQWTSLALIDDYDPDTGEVLESYWWPATITMSSDRNAILVTTEFHDGVLEFDLYRVGAAPTIEEEVIVDGFTINASSGSGGSISDEGAAVVAEGGSKTYTITPQSRDYEISDVLVDGVSVGAVNSYTFENVQGNHTIYVDFGIITKAAKPAAEPAAEPVAVEPPVEELPYTGFDWMYPFMGLGMLLAGSSLMLALKKLRRTSA